MAAGAVPERVLWSLGVTYTLTMWVVGAMSIVFLRRYRITRAGYHESVARSNPSEAPT
jgi:hypothetical protein